MPVPKPHTWVHGVQETDDKLVYLVASDRSGEAPHRVDMEAFGGFGECNCWDFVTRRDGEPSRKDRLRAGERTLGCMCKHLQRAHLFNSVKFNCLVLREANKRSPRHLSDAERSYG